MIANELTTTDDLARSLGSYLDDISSESLDGFAVLKDNKPEAVILSIAEYERMRDIENYLEDLEIEQIIRERVIDAKKPIKMISHEEMMGFLKKEGCDV